MVMPRTVFLSHEASASCVSFGSPSRRDRPREIDPRILQISNFQIFQIRSFVDLEFSFPETSPQNSPVAYSTGRATRIARVYPIRSIGGSAYDGRSASTRNPFAHASLTSYHLTVDSRFCFFN